MKAPSEKHLEDWIVANPKRFGEVLDNDEYELPAYVTEGWHWNNERDVIEPCFDRIIARQVRFPFGIADLIVRSQSSVAAVELKRDGIKSDTVAQCLRYMYELKNIFSETFYEIAALPSEQRQEYAYSPVKHIDVTSWPHDEVSGIVVGHSIPDQNLLLVCAVCQIEIVTYEFDGADYHFRIRRCEEELKRVHVYSDFAYGAIGDAFREVMREKAAWESERQS